MPTLRDIIIQNSGMRFMTDSLGLCSAAGRRVLLSSEMMTDADAIRAGLEDLKVFVDLTGQESCSKPIEAIRLALGQLHDIHATIGALANAVTLDDIGLFEIKHFCLLSESVRENLRQCQVDVPDIPDLQEVIRVLDPENQLLPQFYIYDAYSDQLAHLRRQQQNLLASDPQQAEVLRLQCLGLEDEIRKQLSVTLFSEAAKLQQAHEGLARLDIWLAKAMQAVSTGSCQPRPDADSTVYTGLFNPWVKTALSQQNKEFQPVDISFGRSPCLITGANMGGKTVLLSTVALAQLLFQFGFYVPASEASIVPVEEVVFNTGDEQSELSGLSSFAAGMLRINQILSDAVSGRNILALIDEPARTTNPDEGRAIVNALVNLLGKYAVRSLVTTHYGGVQATCRKLRVRGLQVDGLNENITIRNLNNYMDYSLLEHDADDVPLEALRIASILGVNRELIDQAASFLNQTEQRNNT